MRLSGHAPLSKPSIRVPSKLSLLPGCNLSSSPKLPRVRQALPLGTNMEMTDIKAKWSPECKALRERLRVG
jgi:hypothetical protein